MKPVPKELAQFIDRLRSLIPPEGWAEVKTDELDTVRLGTVDQKRAEELGRYLHSLSTHGAEVVGQTIEVLQELAGRNNSLKAEVERLGALPPQPNIGFDPAGPQARRLDLAERALIALIPYTLEAVNACRERR